MLSSCRRRVVVVSSSYRRRVVMPSCRRVVVPSCRRVVVSSCRRVVVSSCRRVVVSSCRRVVVGRHRQWRDWTLVEKGGCEHRLTKFIKPSILYPTATHIKKYLRIALYIVSLCIVSYPHKIKFVECDSVCHT